MAVGQAKSAVMPCQYGGVVFLYDECDLGPFSFCFPVDLLKGLEGTCYGKHQQQRIGINDRRGREIIGNGDAVLVGAGLELVFKILGTEIGWAISQQHQLVAFMDEVGHFPDLVLIKGLKKAPEPFQLAPLLGFGPSPAIQIVEIFLVIGKSQLLNEFRNLGDRTVAHVGRVGDADRFC